ncbi:MAG: hypothetical protein AAF702_51280 [Chloroflexota bacterium]
MTTILFVAQLTTTLFMTGVIWIVQIVHYPLFARVGRDGFSEYENSHSFLITFVVMPPMLVEIGSAFFMLFLRSPLVPAWSAWLGFALVLLIWLSTFFLQVPQHTILASGFDDAAHRILVSSNWVRTVAWSLRSVLLLWLLTKLLG